MKKLFIILSSALLLLSCNKERLGRVQREEVTFQAVIGYADETKVTANADYIGRKTFVDKDIMLLTDFYRTNHQIENFVYHNLKYQSNASQSWNRIVATGEPERIYWSDNSSHHTAIGYSTPQAWADHDDKWTQKPDGKLYGYFTPTVDGDKEVIDFTDNDKIKAEDLLICHDKTLVADKGGSVATLRYRHSLASIRIIVQLMGFAQNDATQDAHTKVYDMRVLQQPWKYVWDRSDWSTEDATDPETDGLKDFLTWIPKPEGSSKDKSGNYYTFYSLMVPSVTSVSTDTQTRRVELEFSVDYPDALNNEQIVKNVYRAAIDDVLFKSGYTTTLRITLNHKDEKINIGAEYIDWENVETPDDSELKKNATYLSTVDMSKVTLAADKGLKKDATWLYTDSAASPERVLDIYDNDGSEAHPYIIKNALQFLSFAKEVNSGRDFTGQFVQLDAGLYLQPSTTSSDLSWPGIGTLEKPFNGTFLGGNRIIKRLKGKPLFAKIGPLGRVHQLRLEDVLDITGPAAFAVVNEGIICAVRVASIASGFALTQAYTVTGLRRDETDNKDAQITWADADPNNGNGSTTVAAPIVAYNSGIVMTSYASGKYTTVARRTGNIVGYNSGAMVVSYAACKATKGAGSSVADPFFRGSVAYNRYKPGSLTAGVGEGPNHLTPIDGEVNYNPTGYEYGILVHCFFDKDVADNVNAELAVGWVSPMTTAAMQSSAFIGAKDSTDPETLNGNIQLFADNTNFYPKRLLDAYKTAYEDNYSTAIEQMVTYFKQRYYEYRAASYPVVN